MDYLTLKWLHILSSTVLFGAGIGSAFHLFMASLRGDPQHVAATARVVVVADWLLTTPTAILQPLTGVWLMHMLGQPITSKWLMWSSVLYALAIASWLPVLWLQIRMRDVATASAAALEARLPRAYRVYFGWWTALGTVALFAFLAIFYLMVFKPY
jgi:uncharacterized membrane protein